MTSAGHPDIAADGNATVLVVGYGLHGQAVDRALRARSFRTIVVDDGPSAGALAVAAAEGIDIGVAPDADSLAWAIEAVDLVLPTPGLPERHEVFALAASAGRPVISEFDLAGAWDDRRIVAITGTNGKTTVTMMVTAMLQADGIRAVAAGNTDDPLVTAIDDRATEVFVVEASSFRLGHSRQFRPAVATWLNFAPDHLDVHVDLDRYERAKAAIWRDQRDGDIAVANAEDPVVMRNVMDRGRTITFGLHIGDSRIIDDELVVDGTSLVHVDELARSLPHDRANALAAATTAMAAGVSRAAIVSTLRSFVGLPHRVQLVGTADGVRWYDDSKATTPHAVVAGVAGFESAVLIAGGRNKGVDLTPLAMLAPKLRAVVAIGEAAGEIAAVFAERVRVVPASSMDEAVSIAATVAESGDAVVLSPACTSYDWYANYGERGDDFARCVRALLTGATQ